MCGIVRDVAEVIQADDTFTARYNPSNIRNTVPCNILKYLPGVLFSNRTQRVVSGLSETTKNMTGNESGPRNNEIFTCKAPPERRRRRFSGGVLQVPQNISISVDQDRTARPPQVRQVEILNASLKVVPKLPVRLAPP